MPNRAVGKYDTSESILSMLKALVRMPRRTKPIVDLMAPSRRLQPQRSRPQRLRRRRTTARGRRRSSWPS
jgi:hypothetical protein